MVTMHDQDDADDMQESGSGSDISGDEFTMDNGQRKR
jgi:hypothetical protein